MSEPVLLIHGGSSSERAPDEPGKEAALAVARDAGLSLLLRDAPAEEAVSETIRVLEDSGRFLAGAGAAPQRDGVVRFDASLMRSDGGCGAVVSVSRTPNPILAARAVLQGTRHSTLVGPVADEVVAALGVRLGEVRRDWERAVPDCVSDERAEGGEMFPGTVGAVARDRAGRLAAGTSTGGYEKALPGRTGDSGALGSGTYATERCAVSCSGDGDHILAAGLAAVVDAWLDVGVPAAEVFERLLVRMRRYDVPGGIIALVSDGTAWVIENGVWFRTLSTTPARTVGA